jgi:hypothetical protein
MSFDPNDPAQVALQIATTGPLVHDGPGRHDDMNINVPAEAFVVPSDIVSALGDGNTLAGFKVLDAIFPRSGGNPTKNAKVPIIAAGGEYVVGPEHVARMGNGNMKDGHNRLRDFVKQLRSANVKRLSKLPPPVKG